MTVAIRAPGTTHACKGILAEEIDFPVRLKDNLFTLLDSFQCEFSDLLCQ